MNPSMNLNWKNQYGVIIPSVWVITRTTKGESCDQLVDVYGNENRANEACKQMNTELSKHESDTSYQVIRKALY